MLPLGKELQKRGHRVTLIGVVDAKPKTLVPQGGIRSFKIQNSK
jgi:UDP:flavonoid glycosyltransferase YjiC (YdhE family)